MKKSNNISLKELKVQLGLGLIAPDNALATIIGNSTDTNVLAWAFKHKIAKIRAAALSNPRLPVGLFIYGGLFASTQTERRAYNKMLSKRKKDMQRTLQVIAEYPQLSLVFPDDPEDTIKYE